MKTIKVVAAVIRDGDKIFATQRGYGDLKGGWEFPGGKIEEGETPQEALKREIMEELDTEIEVGELILKEHEAARWLGKNELMDVEWLPADVKLINRISKDVSLM